MLSPLCRDGIGRTFGIGDNVIRQASSGKTCPLPLQNRYFCFMKAALLQGKTRPFEKLVFMNREIN